MSTHIPIEHTEAFHLYLEIPTVEIRVGPKHDSPGRVEKFNSAGQLLARLDDLGVRRWHILALSEAGQVLPQIHVDALNLYLHANHGLRSFRRISHFATYNRFAWGELRARLAIPELAVIVPVC